MAECSDISPAGKSSNGRKKPNSNTEELQKCHVAYKQMLRHKRFSLNKESYDDRTYFHRNFSNFISEILLKGRQQKSNNIVALYYNT